jgi:hypothetical protein
MAEAVHPRDIEIKKLKDTAGKWSLLMAVLTLIPAGILIYDWVTDLYQSNQTYVLAWLLGDIIIRLSFPITDYLYMTREMSLCLNRFYLIYFSIIFWWDIYGTGVFIKGWIELAGTNGPFHGSQWVWVLAILTYLIDFVTGTWLMLYSFCGYRSIYKRYPLEEVNIPQQVEIKVNTVPTHRFYDECVICTEKFKDDNMVKTLPCHHVFHNSCIDRWLSTSDVCPTCKCKI